MTDEEYVRSRWLVVMDARDLDNPSVAEPIRIQVSSTKQLRFAWFANAARYTRERERQIAEIEEEIALHKGLIILLRSEPGDLTAPVWQRRLARLQSELAELRRGMKTPEDERE